MAVNQYMSHWNLLGYGPDVRFSLAGGTEAVQENVYSSWQRFDDGRPVPVTDWETEVRKAHESLMSSPGHRVNILNPDHTQVGIGLAYDLATGEFRVAQEFINRYVVLQPVPQTARVSDMLTISGRLMPGASNPLVNIAYEPLPQPMTAEELSAMNTYQSPAQIVETISALTSSDGSFTAVITLDKPGSTGLYHIRIWIQYNERDVQAVDALVWVSK
jgi:hypothetical protein